MCMVEPITHTSKLLTRWCSVEDTCILTLTAACQEQAGQEVSQHHVTRVEHLSDTPSSWSTDNTKHIVIIQTLHEIMV